LQVDVWEKQYRVISLEKAKRPECATCGLHSFPALHSEKASHMALCGRDAVQIKPEREVSVDLDSVQRRWEKGDRIYRNPFLLKMILPENEIILFPDGRAIIKGTIDFSRARTLYAKYVGM
jgi:molybdopterin-synthase adenylyltransferase